MRNRSKEGRSLILNSSVFPGGYSFNTEIFEQTWVNRNIFFISIFIVGAFDAVKIVVFEKWILFEQCIYICFIIKYFAYVVMAGIFLRKIFLLQRIIHQRIIKSRVSITIRLFVFHQQLYM